MKWGDNARDFDRPLAVWPHYRPLFDNWLMQELVEQGDRAPVWRDRRVPSENGRVRGDVYSDRETARSAAATLNQTAAELAWKAGCRGISQPVPRERRLVELHSRCRGRLHAVVFRGVPSETPFTSTPLNFTETYRLADCLLA